MDRERPPLSTLAAEPGGEATITSTKPVRLYSEQRYRASTPRIVCNSCTDLTIETRLGPQAVTQVYNSASDRWRWSFETTYAGGVFTDESGAEHALGALAPGAIPGTRWKKVDASTLETRGGLRYAFGADGRLASVAWRHAAFPRLEWRREGATLRIVQCTGAGSWMILAE